MTAPALEGLRVLVVEDEMFLCMDIEDMLVEFGCVVVGPAARVEQALEIIEREAVDLAMLDVNLGFESSYPIAERLSSLQVPYFFATGYSELDAAQQGRPRLQKPFSGAQLQDMLLRTGGPRPTAQADPDLV